MGYDAQRVAQIGTWLRANGGAPAVIFAGVALLAVSAPLGIALIAIGVLGFILQLNPVRIFAIHRLGGMVEGDREPPISLRRAMANTLTELGRIKSRLAQAAESGYLSDLPAEHYQPLADFLTDRGCSDGRQSLDEAYGGCDDLRHRLSDPERGFEGPMAEPCEPRIEDSDNLPGLQKKVDAAIADLRQRQALDAAQ